MSQPLLYGSFSCKSAIGWNESVGVKETAQRESGLLGPTATDLPNHPHNTTTSTRNNLSQKSLSPQHAPLPRSPQMQIKTTPHRPPPAHTVPQCTMHPSVATRTNEHRDPAATDAVINVIGLAIWLGCRAAGRAACPCNLETDTHHFSAQHSPVSSLGPAIQL